jgi:hypothetical protein
MRVRVTSGRGSMVDAAVALEHAGWVAWNTSYHTEHGTVYRDLSRAFYREALHERIAQLFAALDAQNARLDDLLGDSASERKGGN